MRRRLFRHEQKMLPRIVHAGSVAAASVPGKVAAEGFSVHDLNATQATGKFISGSAAIHLGAKRLQAHFHTTAASTEIVIDGFFYRLTHAQFQGEGEAQNGALEL